MLYRYSLFRISVLVTVFALWQCENSPPGKFDQQMPALVSPQMQERLALALQFININQTDSAQHYLQPIVKQLEQADALSSSFGLQVRLAVGKALARANQNKQALALLNQLKSDSERSQIWDAYAETSLVLAALHRKIYRSEEAREHLESARAVITQRRLDDLYPKLAIELAFWHSSFAHLDSMQHYVRQAELLTADSLEFTDLKTDLLLLKAYQHQTSDQRTCIGYLKQAATIAKAQKDDAQLSFLWNEIARISLFIADTISFLPANDACIRAAYRALAAGVDNTYILAQAYKWRSNYYKFAGRLDSALFYNSRGFTQEEAFRNRQERDRIVEIDARYKDEQKTFRLAEQAKTIRRERQIRWLFVGLALLTLSFIVILVRLYLRLRSAYRTTEEQAGRLRQLDIAKSRFFANVSHELRTPLTLLRGPIRSLLQDNQLPPRQREMLQLAGQSSRQLEQLVTEILDLQKLEEGELKLELLPTDLPKFFQPFLAQFESLARQRSVRFEARLQLEAQSLALIDREKCRRIYYNLLSNAFKFTPRGGQIRSRVQMDGGRLMMRVADSGPGIHPDDLPYVFDRYFQTNRPERPAEGGTGIGLALSREYARMMGGDIEVQSRPGAGAVFTVSIPVQSPAEISPVVAGTGEVQKIGAIVKASKKMPVPAPADGAHLLLVEDHEDIQTYLRAVLADRYRITSAHNGLEAVQLLEDSNNYDLILTDLMMPGMDGFQLVEWIKQRTDTRHIPIVVLSARAEMRDRLKMLRFGVDDYLLKPFEEEELRVRIDNLLRNQHIRQTLPAQTGDDHQANPLLSAADQIWLEELERHVRENMSDPELNVLELARHFAMSRSTFLRQVKRLTGLTPVQYLQEARLNEALQLLETGRYYSIAETADAVGFADPRSFSRSFKGRFGKLPSHVSG